MGSGSGQDQEFLCRRVVVSSRFRVVIKMDLSEENVPALVPDFKMDLSEENVPVLVPDL